MRKHTLTIALLILCNSFVVAQDKLKFSTKQTRELWQICSVSFRNLNPGIRADTYYPVCDCYVDHIRANYTSEQIVTNGNNSMRMSQKEYNKLSKELKSICNPNTQKLEELT
jgi:hypothetical protein|tara:strand:+ start:968 stop:1303 length:336 start_codon:yes stop_codon:yes gene_type:complete